MNSETEPIKKPQTHCLLLISKEFKKRLKIAAAQHDMTMGQFLESLKF